MYMYSIKKKILRIPALETDYLLHMHCAECSRLKTY